MNSTNTTRTARLGWLLLSALLVLADQLTKLLVVESLVLYERVELLPVLSLMRLHNSGIAFGLFNLPGGVQLLIIIPVALLVSAYLLREMLMRPAPDLWRSLGISLVLAGALGNLIDRISAGYVVDFVLMHLGDRAFPAYNLADVCITFGVIAWIWSLLKESGSERDASGFTLLEIMVTLAIIAVLALIAVPTYVAFSDRAERTAAEADLLSCAAGLERLLLEGASVDEAADNDGDGLGDAATGTPAARVCSPRSSRYALEIREFSQDTYRLEAVPEADSGLPRLAYDAEGATLVDLDADGDFNDEGENTWN